MEEVKFAATVKVLKENDIEADGYEGIIWCSEVYYPHTAYCFSLKNGKNDWFYKLTTDSDTRVAVAFRKFI